MVVLVPYLPRMRTNQLDDVGWLISRLGGEDVLRSVRGLGEQIMTGLRGGLQIPYPDTYRSVKNIVLCGMGGSRFPGTILQYLYRSNLRVPLEICDDYLLPGSVNEHTLVILSSYSGTTEEVLSCADKAQSVSAMITGYCTGGALGQFFKTHHLPHTIFTETFNPSRQPRMGFGYAFGSLLGILTNLSLISGLNVEGISHEVQTELGDLAQRITSFDVDVVQSKNPAKTIAASLVDRYPYYIVAEHMTGVGNCMQNQTNETAKNFSSYRVIPELNHHLMEGLKNPKAHRAMAMFVFFTSELYSKQVGRRVRITVDVVRQNGIEVLEYALTGTSRLGQVVEGMALSSYITMYLAALYGEDPETVPYVDYFKKKLRELS